MLVLTRRADEEVIIGEDISVKVVEIRGNVVRLGFNAPADVTIHRREVYEAIVKANEAAAGISAEEIEQLQK
jgi:carbon storage regulator